VRTEADYLEFEMTWAIADLETGLLGQGCKALLTGGWSDEDKAKYGPGFLPAAVKPLKERHGADGSVQTTWRCLIAVGKKPMA
jgi:hypothetical protein